MKLNVDFSDLHIATAKMQGLHALLIALREQKVTFDKGLEIASEFVTSCGGTVETVSDGVQLTLLNDQAVCMQLYSDIDRFYYEI